MRNISTCEVLTNPFRKSDVTYIMRKKGCIRGRVGRVAYGDALHLKILLYNATFVGSPTPVYLFVIDAKSHLSRLSVGMFQAYNQKIYVFDVEQPLQITLSVHMLKCPYVSMSDQC